MSDRIHIEAPLSGDGVRSLKAGDNVLISGVVYAARDAAHKKLKALLDEGKELPFDISGQIIYYVGPCPARPGEVIGSAGPTTSGRMVSFKLRNAVSSVATSSPETEAMTKPAVMLRSVYKNSSSSKSSTFAMCLPLGSYPYSVGNIEDNACHAD